MRKYIKQFVIPLLLILLFQAAATAQSNHSFDKQKLDTYLNTLFEEHKFMGTVAIDSAGETVYQKSVGFSQKGEKLEEVDENTIYRIGSITKTFTAAVILQLIEEGKISLSTKLARFYPDLPQADEITIEHLLRHQSGLFNFTNADDYGEWMTEKQSKEQLLKMFRNQEPKFSSGARFSYSNTNYVLLGFIIEDITGDRFAEQIQKRITEPLNLEDTYIGDGIDPKKGEAASFRYTQSGWQKLPETDMSVPRAAGALVSTTEDMIDFMRALFSGKLISEESLQKMVSIEHGYGMGLARVPFNNKTGYGHNGGIDGFISHLSYFPQEDVTLTVVSNGLAYNFNDILIGVLSIYFGEDFEIPSFDVPTITLSSEQKQYFTGDYSSDQLPLDIKVFVKDSVLKAQATGQAAFPLKATNLTTLRFDLAGLVMEFDSLKNKKYQQFILNQAGGKFLFERKQNQQ